MSCKSHENVYRKIAKTDVYRRLIYCEVYVPNMIDAHGNYMTEDDVAELAHNYLASGATDHVDYEHDNRVDRGCYVVESFVAREGDPDFAPHSWVAAIYVGDEEMWGKVLNSEITGVSIEAWFVIDPPEEVPFS